MPSRQEPDGTAAGNAKRLASRFCQLKAGHSSPGSTYVERKTGPPLSAGGVGTGQTWDHLFKVCPEWRAQQKVLWAEV